MTTAKRRARHARHERNLEAAQCAYRERFGADAPVPPYTTVPRFTDALMAAVESGGPLTAEALAKWLGNSRYARWSQP